MTCQHPNCLRSIDSICANHCHWSLCQEHINEHRKSLLIEFEQVLEDLIKPTNEFSKSIEQTKQIFKEDQQKELDHLKQFHQKQINEIEQQLINITKFQEQYNKISNDLIKIKTNEHLLTQNHFQQIDILSNEINQYKNSLIDQEENIIHLQQKQLTNIQCPLTSLNIYGLLPSHNVRLCSPKRKIQHLFEHFRNYHHLTTSYANELIKAMTLNLDPIQTIIFPSDASIIVIDTKKPCPLHNTSKESGIRCTPCTNFVTDTFLPIHLKTIHHLRAPQIKDIIKTN